MGEFSDLSQGPGGRGGGGLQFSLYLNGNIFKKFFKMFLIYSFPTLQQYKLWRYRDFPALPCFFLSVSLNEGKAKKLKF